MNNTVKRLPIGGNRIDAIEIMTTPPLCVCCVYMPSRNSNSTSSDKENYQHVLDQLEEILNTYTRTHTVAIVGDMNASLKLRKGNNQDILLKNFMDTNDLFCSQTEIETFFHPNKTDKAEIIYILLNSQSRHAVRKISVDSMTVLNTSDHTPVIGTFGIQIKGKIRQNIKVTCKPKWDRCDKRVYQAAVRRNLLPFDTFLPSLNSEVDILQSLGHLNAVLKLAISASIPKFKSEITIRQLRNRPWSKRIYDAAKKCRLE